MTEREPVVEAIDQDGPVDPGRVGHQTWFQSLLLAGLCLGSGVIAGRISTLLSTVVIGLGINLLSQVIGQVNLNRAQLPKKVVELDTPPPGDDSAPIVEAVTARATAATAATSQTRVVLAVFLVAMTVLGLVLGRASESGGFEIDMPPTTPTSAGGGGGSGTTSIPTTTSSSTTTTAQLAATAIEIIAPETLKVGHQNELFTRVPPGAQVEYVFQGQRYPAVVKDFWIRPDEPGEYDLQVIVRDNTGVELFDDTLTFEAVPGQLSERTCNRFLRSEISDLVGLDILLDSAWSTLGLNSCVWQVPDQPTQALAMAIHEGVSAEAMAAWLATTTATAVEVPGAERAWQLAADDGIRILATSESSLVDVTIGSPLPVADATAVAMDVVAFGLRRVVLGESPPALACQLFTAEEVSLVAQTPLVQAEPEIPTSCRYTGTLAQIDVSVSEGGDVDLDEIAAAAGLEAFSSSEVEIEGFPALILSVDGDIGTVIGLNAETVSLGVAVVRLSVDDGDQKSAEAIARELMRAAVNRS